MGFTFAQILPAERLVPLARASGGTIYEKMQPIATRTARSPQWRRRTRGLDAPLGGFGAKVGR